jgi:hypothetical protein
MTRFLSIVALTLGISALLNPQSGSAAVISVFGTGLSAGGTPLPGGSADPHYTVVETGTAARVLTSPHPLYVPNSSTSLWIWENATGFPINVTRTFRTTFDLTGLDPSSAVLNGLWGVDNIGFVYLNGVYTGVSLPVFTTGNFTSLHPYTITSGFVPGINTLDFVVTDFGVVSAFRTDLSGTADPLVTVPEPGMMAVWSVLAAMAWVARGRGKRRVVHAN